jgi:predicted Zn-dependent peptidase
MGYSGTTTERAQETLDVMLAEFRRLSDGIEQAELDRLKTQLRSTLIMQQESCRSRASNLAIDWHHLGRVRTLDELDGTIRGLSVDGILSTLQRHPLSLLSTVTYGKESLTTPNGSIVPA